MLQDRSTASIKMTSSAARALLNRYRLLYSRESAEHRGEGAAAVGGRGRERNGRRPNQYSEAAVCTRR